MIRHGQASFGQKNYDRLSPVGRRQTHILAQFLFRTGFLPDAVYSGTMNRQKETAEEFAAAYRAEGKALPQVVEIAGFNEFAMPSIVAAMFPGMAAEDSTLKEDFSKIYTSNSSFRRVYEGAMSRWATGRFDTPEIESWKDVKARVTGSVREIMERHGRDKSIAVFTSGGDIAAYLSHVLAIPAGHAIGLSWQVVNTSITRFIYNRDTITLSGFNLIAHLELAGDPSLITYR